MYKVIKIQGKNDIMKGGSSGKKGRGAGRGEAKIGGGHGNEMNGYGLKFGEEGFAATKRLPSWDDEPPYQRHHQRYGERGASVPQKLCLSDKAGRQSGAGGDGGRTEVWDQRCGVQRQRVNSLNVNSNRKPLRPTIDKGIRHGGDGKYRYGVGGGEGGCRFEKGTVTPPQSYAKMAEIANVARGAKKERKDHVNQIDFLTPNRPGLMTSGGGREDGKRLFCPPKYLQINRNQEHEDSLIGEGSREFLLDERVSANHVEPQTKPSGSQMSASSGYGSSRSTGSTTSSSGSRTTTSGSYSTISSESSSTKSRNFGKDLPAERPCGDAGGCGGREGGGGGCWFPSANNPVLLLIACVGIWVTWSTFFESEPPCVTCGCWGFW